ncbi:hypothetical protein PGR6_21730 [Pseudomonas sp. GR 6-02]|nr:hypothetical protein PGR6_21730 [Pseudomonas sp. GR 6-02]
METEADFFNRIGQERTLEHITWLAVFSGRSGHPCSAANIDLN